MGARQSSEATQDTDVFVDYYELLEVDQNEPVEGIRKSYRRLALRWHPDKNTGNEQEANKKFTKLQEAYEVLSDEQERAWYDQNRERLMQGGEEDEEEDVDAKFRFFRSGGAAPKATSLAPGVGVAHLFRFYSPSIAKDLSDSDSSFFGTYRRLFSLIAEEDRVAAPYPGEAHENDFADPDRDDASWYIGFGHPDTPYVSKDGRRDVRQFYQFWTNFSSRKSFAWKDKFDLRDAQDRRVKRLMEKDNKRARDTSRREYSEAIRALALFIRRRDPRFKAYQASQSSAANSASAAEVEARRKAEAAKRQEEKRAQAASFQAQSWQMADEPEADWASDFSSGESYVSNSLSSGPSDQELNLDDEFDCVACNKRFQSRAAWENHERSKKHKKEVQRLQREMREEDDLLLGDDDNDLAQDTQALYVDDDAASASRKKDKKKKKMEKKMRAALGESNEAPESKQQPAPSSHPLAATLPHLASLPQFPHPPPGSFDVFGYGSLIFKPPPHAIGYTPGFIQGFARRFAQHSVDHRGTPERPGRVVTLVKSEDWKKLPDADEAPEGDIVWGISYTIDPAYADEVRAYLDYREKNGYTPMHAPILGVAADVEDTASEQTKVLIPDALVYVGLPDNEAFVGAEPLEQLAERIFTCQGPSGRNDEYLLRLAEAVRLLTPHSKDHHLFTLESKVLALREAEAQRIAADAQASSADVVRADAVPTDTVPPSGGSKPRRRAKRGEAGGTGPERCNVCRAKFPSRSKLFTHLRETGHAQAAPLSKRKNKP